MEGVLKEISKVFVGLNSINHSEYFIRLKNLYLEEPTNRQIIEAFSQNKVEKSLIHILTEYDLIDQINFLLEDLVISLGEYLNYKLILISLPSFPGGFTYDQIINILISRGFINKGTEINIPKENIDVTKFPLNNKKKHILVFLDDLKILVKISFKEDMEDGYFIFYNNLCQRNTRENKIQKISKVFKDTYINLKKNT